MLQKGWIIENDKRVLVKGIYQTSREEPINEWLASEICKRLDFYHCEYTIKMEMESFSVIQIKTMKKF